MHVAFNSGRLESWLRRAWSALCRFVEALDYNPVEEMAGRLERLEREITALKDTRRG